MADPGGKQRYTAWLRDSGLKATPTRLLVLQCLDLAPEPLSAGDIHARAGQVRPTDRVTVYRTLESLYRAGLAERTRSGDGRAWLYHLIAAPDHGNHPHFHCTGCGALECLPPETVNLDLKRLKRVFPARLEHLSISLNGLCPACLAKDNG